VHYIRFFLACDEIARFVFGQAGHHLGQNFREFPPGVELLQLCPQAGALGRGGGEGVLLMYLEILLKNSIIQSFLDKLLVVQ